MDPNTRSLVMGAAGGAGVEKIYVEDVFSTYLYTGNGSTQTITNGIDLSGKGGLTWIKIRSTTFNHILVDTLRGTGQNLSTNNNLSATFSDQDVTSFNNNGFSLGVNGRVNANTSPFVSWTFRKAEKFFDVVTYTGNGVFGRTVNHNLGSVPGCIIVKRTDSGGQWFVYHRSTGASAYVLLNSTAAAVTGSSVWNDLNPTSTSFQVASSSDLNANGGTFVAYLFAHDAGGFGDSGNDNVISCGSVTTNGSGQIPTVNLGWEPQWLIMKNTTSESNWDVYDTMRGWVSQDQNQFNRLSANVSSAEATAANGPAVITSTGFRSNTADFGASQTYIYIAIRRGPMKTPTAGTDVFYAELEPQTDLRQSEGVPFPPDLVNTYSRNGTDRISGFNLFTFVDRLRGLGTPNDTFGGSGRYLISSSTGAENSINQSFVQLKADGRNITSGTGWNSSLYGNFIYYFFRRAPGFFDIVAYTGANGNPTINHNLGVTPELIITKTRSGSDQPDWFVASSYLPGGFTVNGGILNLNTSAASTSQGYFTSVTSSSLQLSNVVARSGQTYIAYLFASCPGVSKVGSYTGTGATLNIDCGFTNGARFVVIKRIDQSGSWEVFDTARGIIAADDPLIRYNSTAEESASDRIDPYSPGFSVPANVNSPNVSGGQYLFLAIA